MAAGAGNMMPRPAMWGGLRFANPTYQFVSPALIVLERDPARASVELQTKHMSAVEGYDQNSF
jgi:hypothetical protein